MPSKIETMLTEIAFRLKDTERRLTYVEELTKYLDVDKWVVTTEELPTRTSDDIKIAICGKMRSGKDLAAFYLTQKHGFTQFAFGDALKEHAHAIFEKQDGKQRSLYQWFGQTMRQRDPDVWVNAVERTINESNPNRIVISDLRQPNEYEWAKANGYTIVRINASEEKRIKRMAAKGDVFNPEDMRHDTESHIEGFDVDYEISNDGTHSELFRQLDDIVTESEVLR